MEEAKVAVIWEGNRTRTEEEEVQRAISMTTPVNVSTVEHKRISPIIEVCGYRKKKVKEFQSRKINISNETTTAKIIIASWKTFQQILLR